MKNNDWDQLSAGEKETPCKLCITHHLEVLCVWGCVSTQQGRQARPLEGKVQGGAHSQAHAG